MELSEKKLVKRTVMNDSELLHTHTKRISSGFWKTVFGRHSFLRPWGIISPIRCIEVWGWKTKMGLETIPIWRQK
jgi:hypothetical protein